MPATFLEDEEQKTGGATLLDDEPLAVTAGPVALTAGAQETVTPTRVQEIKPTPPIYKDPGRLTDIIARAFGAEADVSRPPVVERLEASPTDTKLQALGKGVVNVGNEIIPSLINPESWNPGAIPQMITNQVARVSKAAGPEATPQEQAEGVLSTAAMLLLPVLGKAFGGRRAATPGLSERLAPITGERIAEPIIEQPKPQEVIPNAVPIESPAKVGAYPERTEIVRGQESSERVGPIEQGQEVARTQEAVTDVPLEPLSPGPGAASAKEPLASYEERRFGKRFQEDEKIAPEIREDTGNRFYEPIPNKVTVADAERIIEQRGTDDAIRLVRDENEPIEPRVRATLGQSLIKKLNQSNAEAKAAGDAVSAERFLNEAVDTAEYLSEYGTRLGQGVQSFAIWNRLTPEGALLEVRRATKRAQDRIKKTDPDISPDKLPSLTPETEARILELAQRVQESPEGLPKDRATRDLNKFVAQQKGFDPSDLPIGVYYGNILSGYNTHIVNSLDTFLNVASEINGLAINNPRAAASVYGGMIRGLGEGKLDAIHALTEGRMVTDGKWMDAPRLMEVARFGEKGGVPIKTETLAGRVLKRAAELPIAKPLNAYKYVTRLLAASDAVMFRSAKEARASLLAHRMAEAEGLKGDALLNRQREILAQNQLADFRAQAKREGFEGRTAEVRAKELRDQMRPEELTEDAADFAGEATYNHEPHGVIGYLAQQTARISENIPILKLFVPFTRIVANVTNRGLNWTPYGYKRVLIGYGRGEKLSGEARRLMLTRATLGTGALTTLGFLQSQGLLQVHGAGPTDQEKLKQLKSSGWRPYSIQIGDTYMSYVYTPVGLGLSVLGNMTDGPRYHELEEKDAATRAAYAASRIPSTVFSQSFLSGLSRLFDALSVNPGQTVAAVKKVLSSTVGALTTPNLIRDVQRLFDPKLYRADTFGENLLQNTPFAALVSRPAINAFGEPVKQTRQRFIGQLTDDPVWRMVVELGLRVPVPNKATEIKKGEQITPQQYYQLLKESGPDIKDWIKHNESTLRSKTREEAQDDLSQEASKIRKRHLQRLR